MNSSEQMTEQIARMPSELKLVLDRQLAAGTELAEMELAGSPDDRHVSLRMTHPFRAATDSLPPGVTYREITDRDPMIFQFCTADERWSLWTGKFKPMVLPPLPTGPDPMLEHAAAMEIVRAREEAAESARTRRQAGPAEKAVDEAAEEDSLAAASPGQPDHWGPAATQFLQSMTITYEMWHDGTGYDLVALAEALPAEREAIARHLINHRPRDWRDIEALAAIDSPPARSAIAQALKSGDIQVRQEAMKYAAQPIDPSDRQRLLIHHLNTANLFGGLSAAIDEAAEFHPPPVVTALLEGVMNRDGEVAVHFAALLLYIFGKAREPFDWDQRPFVLRFQTTDLTLRKLAFLELCQTIGVDPATQRGAQLPLK